MGDMGKSIIILMVIGVFAVGFISMKIFAWIIIVSILALLAFLWWSTQFGKYGGSPEDDEREAYWDNYSRHH